MEYLKRTKEEADLREWHCAPSTKDGLATGQYLLHMAGELRSPTASCSCVSAEPQKGRQALAEKQSNSLLLSSTVGEMLGCISK